LAANGQTYECFVTAVDMDGHESLGSQRASGTPRVDYTGQILYDYSDVFVQSRSGFRFQEDEDASPILYGFHSDAHFTAVQAAGGRWWLWPNGGSEVHPDGIFTTALKCGLAADATCLDGWLGRG
jgi:hypothetical protein